ncbi:MAG: hypothetical protein HY593_03690 [Candidatus Omnitrophica bacterium]|nr:hypothetical protein [Candidatus Omnitrophota bacterium]
MRKFLVVLGVFVVLAAGLGGALALLPHAHSGEIDHAKHQDCPLYQIGSHLVGFTDLGKTALPVFFLFLFCLSWDCPAFYESHSELVSTRAPPAFPLFS